MIGVIDKTVLCKIAFAIEMLNGEGFFAPIQRVVSAFPNYDFIFSIEKLAEEIKEIPIDFVTGAEPFTIKGFDTETYKQGRWTVAKINRKGLSIFPEKLSDSENNDAYREYKYDLINAIVEWLKLIIEGKEVPDNIF